MEVQVLPINEDQDVFAHKIPEAHITIKMVCSDYYFSHTYYRFIREISVFFTKKVIFK